MWVDMNKMGWNFIIGVSLFFVITSQLTFQFSCSVKVWVFVGTGSKSRPMVWRCCVPTAGHWLPCGVLDGNEDVSSEQTFA